MNRRSFIKTISAAAATIATPTIIIPKVTKMYWGKPIAEAPKFYDPHKVTITMNGVEITGFVDDGIDYSNIPSGDTLDRYSAIYGIERKLFESDKKLLSRVQMTYHNHKRWEWKTVHDERCIDILDAKIKGDLKKFTSDGLFNINGSNPKHINFHATV